MDFNHIRIKNTTFNFYQASPAARSVVAMALHWCLCLLCLWIGKFICKNQVGMGNSWRQLEPIIVQSILGRYFAFAKFGGLQIYGQESYFAPGSPLRGCWLVRRRRIACWRCFPRVKRITILSLHYFISATPDSALYTPGNNAPWLTWHPAVQSPDPLNFPIVQCQDPPQWALTQQRQTCVYFEVNTVLVQYFWKLAVGVSNISFHSISMLV